LVQTLLSTVEWTAGLPIQEGSGRMNSVFRMAIAILMLGTMAPQWRADEPEEHISPADRARLRRALSEEY
jgi:hypothetical protein